MAVAVCILGSTGSIGCQTLDVIARHPDQFSVFALSAYSNHELLYQQCLIYQPAYVVCVQSPAAAALRLRLRDSNCNTEVLSDAVSLIQIASAAEVDVVVAAIVGAAGLPATFAAVCAGKKNIVSE